MSPRPAETETEAATATTERVEAATAVAAPVAPPPSGAPFIYDLRGHSRGGALCVRVCAYVCVDRLQRLQRIFGMRFVCVP